MGKLGFRSFLRRAQTMPKIEQAGVAEGALSPQDEPEQLPADTLDAEQDPFLATREEASDADRQPIVAVPPTRVALPVSPVALGTPYLFSRAETREWLYDVSGLGGQEARKRWTVAPRASFTVYLPEVCPAPLALVLVAHGLTVEPMPSVTVDVRVCGAPAGVFRCALTDPEGNRQERFAIPDGAVGPGRPVTVDLVVHDPRSPAELGLNDDQRSLGLALVALSIEPR